MQRVAQGNWPYRLELEDGAARVQADSISSFIASLSPLPKSYVDRRSGQVSIVYCFARDDQAGMFQLRFGAKCSEAMDDVGHSASTKSNRGT